MSSFHALSSEEALLPRCSLLAERDRDDLPEGAYCGVEPFLELESELEELDFFDGGGLALLGGGSSEISSSASSLSLSVGGSPSST